MMYSFYVSIHAHPGETTPGPPLEVADGSVATVTVDPRRLAEADWAVSFEQAATNLGALDRLYYEPDGSFVWAQEGPAGRWQIDGNLYDRGEQLARAEVNGTCPIEQFDQLLRAFGWPDGRLLFALHPLGVLVEEPELRALAARG